MNTVPEDSHCLSHKRKMRTPTGSLPLLVLLCLLGKWQCCVLEDVTDTQTDVIDRVPLCSRDAELCLGGSLQFG